MIGWSILCPANPKAGCVQDVYDTVDYLASLGKSQTAAVKRDAEIGVAQVGEIERKIGQMKAKIVVAQISGMYRDIWDSEKKERKRNKQRNWCFSQQKL